MAENYDPNDPNRKVSEIRAQIFVSTKDEKELDKYVELVSDALDKLIAEDPRFEEMFEIMFVKQLPVEDEEDPE